MSKKNKRIEQPNVLFISVDDLNEWEGDKLDRRVEEWASNNSIPMWLR